MSDGREYRDTTASDDSDKSQRQQNKAQLSQICFQCSSVGELDDGWTGAGHNKSVSNLLIIIKTCSFPFYSPPYFPATCSLAVDNPFHFFFIFVSCATHECLLSFLNSKCNLYCFTPLSPSFFHTYCILHCLHLFNHNTASSSLPLLIPYLTLFSSTTHPSLSYCISPYIHPRSNAVVTSLGH